MKSPDHDQTGAAGPASRSAATTAVPDCASHACRAAASARASGPDAPGTCATGTSSPARVRTSSSTQRRASPTWRTSCSSVQSGQVGTVADRSAPEASTAPNCCT
ncbi:hypothetical protein FHS33_003131 [Streptomyces calvus]|uniref:Uncharacterized protein n=1 Tax=Streptomyces calvus TaxID=67282 RepID=A0AA40SE87_9ACTN|nr:hypothetical protein [Streptomyces calvus]GGP67412.1 hypothetical protein GCM10010247_45380 [Streptomyces calvus]